MEPLRPEFAKALPMADEPGPPPPAWKAPLPAGPPGGVGAGGVGGAFPPGASLLVPGCVRTVVPPGVVTDNDTPKTKLAVVAPVLLTEKVAMPPRMPKVAAGVLTVTSAFLLMAPPGGKNCPGGGSF